MKVPITSLPGALQLEHGSPLGRCIVAGLIRESSRSWWALASPTETRAWASNLAALHVVAAVADRQLREIGGDREMPTQIASSAESSAVAAWVLRKLGDPSLQLGRWVGVSERARTILEWILLVDQFAKIIDEFRRHADTERARYWQERFKLVRDARFIEAGGTAVCMMLLRDELIIEFGQIGNACYFYEAANIVRPLRTLNLPRSISVRDFKNRRALEISGMVLPYKLKLSHTRGWQGNFDDYLRSTRTR